jgi:DNA replication protein
VTREPGALPEDRISASLLLRIVRDVWNPLEAKLVIAVAAFGGAMVPVSEDDVLVHADVQLGARADGSDRDVAEKLLDALEVATTRGTLLRLVDDEDSYWLMLGTDENRQRVRQGLLSPVVGRGTGAHSLKLERPSIFTVYEQNIGLVTPIIADQLVEAIERYPESWIVEAMTEAVNYNRRNWRYVQRILENWATEGRTDEANRGDSARDNVRAKHLRGKYAHLFGRDDVPDL